MCKCLYGRVAYPVTVPASHKEAMSLRMLLVLPNAVKTRYGTRPRTYSAVNACVGSQTDPYSQI